MNAVKDLAKTAQDILDEAKQLLNTTATLIIDAKKDFSQIGKLLRKF